MVCKVDYVVAVDQSVVLLQFSFAFFVYLWFLCDRRGKGSTTWVIFPLLLWDSTTPSPPTPHHPRASTKANGEPASRLGRIGDVGPPEL